MAFFGSRTENKEWAIMPKILLILFARLNTPTLEKLEAKLVRELFIAGQPSRIICDNPAGTASFRYSATPFDLILKFFTSPEKGTISITGIIDNPKIANASWRFGTTNPSKNTAEKTPFIKAGIKLV